MKLVIWPSIALKIKSWINKYISPATRFNKFIMIASNCFKLHVEVVPTDIMRCPLDLVSFNKSAVSCHLDNIHYAFRGHLHHRRSPA